MLASVFEGRETAADTVEKEKEEEEGEQRGGKKAPHLRLLNRLTSRLEGCVEEESEQVDTVACFPIFYYYLFFKEDVARYCRAPRLSA